MYEDINEMLDGDIDVTKKYYNQVGRFYDMYHNTLVKLNHLEASLVDDEPGPLNIPDSAVEYNGHYYYLCCNNEAEDYATAENYCKEQGGYLATITSEKENKFLFNYVRKKGYSSAYFGLNNLKDGKAYQWNNGELLFIQNGQKMNRIILSVIMDIMSDLTRMQKTVHGRSIHLVAAKRILIMYFYVSGEIILLLEMMD